ncbi:MAG: DUF1344 domain-containing protein [Proteobacteria bacterium]|nr:DUF1344 domain-containing protein [Pseudomonadota bacterium]
MRFTVQSALAGLALIAMVAGAAAAEITGKIVAIDKDKRTIHLDNGWVYPVGGPFVDLSKFKAGDKVEIYVRQSDNQLTVTDVMMAK